jgi:hypothetical protein
MTGPAEPRNPQQKQPATGPDAEMTEGDLDKVSGGVSQLPSKTPPSGPIPIPYPNHS